MCSRFQTSTLSPQGEHDGSTTSICTQDVTAGTELLNVRNAGEAGSIGCSISSEPLESDYSEDIEENEKRQHHQHQHQRHKGSQSNDKHLRHTTFEDNSNDNEVKWDEDDENVDNNEGDDDDSHEKDTNHVDKCSKVDADQRLDPTKCARNYQLDDFDIIKTLGTGTFGRVCLCRDRVTDTFHAMKILAISDILRLKQVEHVKNERNILREINHPFVISLIWSTKDDCCLYMMLEYICGGELFTYLRNVGRFTSATSNFYAAEIVLALEYLHSLQIAYRDLKPENLLINRDGHIKITDFGFAKKLRDRTWTLCGTPEYLAPEIIQSKGHNRAVDWWALGVLIYEMLIGHPPFYDDNPFGIYEKILGGKIDWPRHMDPIAKDLVKKLLINDRTKRLGNMKNGAEDVKRHRWFKHLNWNDVFNKKLTPPIMPGMSYDGDTSNFDEYPETDWKPARAVEEGNLQLFHDF